MGRGGGKSTGPVGAPRVSRGGPDRPEPKAVVPGRQSRTGSAAVDCAAAPVPAGSAAAADAAASLS